MIKEATKLPLATRLNVRISEVESPGKFWIQKSDESQDLDLLEEDLKLFYESDDALQYELLHFKPSPGHYIAFYVKEDMVWYRGLVRCYASPNKAEVLYIDYGTVLEVHLDDIRYLAPQFEKLNAQGILARLSGIRPREGNEWCADSKRFLWDKAQGAYSKGDLLARVDGYVTTTEGSFISLDILTDKRNSINYQMVKRGFAEYDRPAIISDSFELDPNKRIECRSAVQDRHPTTEGDQSLSRSHIIIKIKSNLEQRQASLMSKADKVGSK
eukprot:13911.XXX_397484_396535_1 [CDS] Oithona nana genome sequencing.